MKRTTGLIVLCSVSLSGCLDFERAYQDCFSSGACFEARGPAVVKSIPAAGTNVADVHGGLTITFDEPVDASTFSAVVTPAVVLGAPEWNADKTEVRYPQAPRYLDDTAYTVQLSGAGLDALPLSATTSLLSFRTVRDATPPTVTSLTPTNDASNVSPLAAPTITFSEPMDLGTLNAIAISPSDCSWALDASQQTATCAHPSGPLNPDTEYTVTVSTGATDLAGLPLSTPLTYRFFTGAVPDTTPPTVVTSVPAHNAVGVDPTKAMSVTFSETMDPVATQAAIAISAPSGRTPVGFSWSSDGKTVTFSLSPAAPLQTDVSWTIGTEAKDLSGNALASAVSRTYRTWRFVTTTLYSDAAIDGGISKYRNQSTGVIGYQLWQGDKTATVGWTTSPAKLTAFLAFDMGPVFANTPIIFQEATLNLWEGQAAINGPTPGSAFGAPCGPIIAENIEYGTTLEEADWFVPAIAAGGATTINISNQVDSPSVHAADVGAWFTQQFAEWDGSGVSAQRLAQFRVKCTDAETLITGTTNYDYVYFATGEAASTATASIVVKYYSP